MSNLSDIDIAKFKAGFDQFQAEDVRKLFSVLKALVYNSSASAPLQMSVDEVQGITLGIQENVGQLVKAKAAIADGSTGKVILTDLLFNEIGDQFDALNLSGSATTNGQTKLVLGKDIAGGFFFRDNAGTGGTCGPGDCPDSCGSNEDWCFEVAWTQGASSGSMYFDISMPTFCTDFLGEYKIPGVIESGFLFDFMKVWDLRVEVDPCAVPPTKYFMTNCAGFDTQIDPIFGTNLGSVCANNVVINSISPVKGLCIGTSTFPCCDSNDGCTCL